MTESSGIWISSTVFVPETEFEYETCRASGPGGQHVNTTDSAVQLRFNVQTSRALPESVRQRILRLGRKAINDNGELIIKAQEFRHQLRNRSVARERLAVLLRKAAQPVAPRKETNVPRGAREDRMAQKHRVSVTKCHRRKVSLDDCE